MRYLLLALLLASCGKEIIYVPVTPPPPPPVIPEPCNPPVANAGSDKNIILGLGLPKFVAIGAPSTEGTTYLWEPASDLSDAKSPQPSAFPAKSVTYTVTATNKCGSTQDSVEVKVFAESSDQ